MEDKYVSGDWPLSTHADLTSTRRTVFHELHITSMTFMLAHLYANVYMWVGVARALVDLSNFGLLGEQRLRKMGDSLP